VHRNAQAGTCEGKNQSQGRPSGNETLPSGKNISYSVHPHSAPYVHVYFYELSTCDAHPANYNRGTHSSILQKIARDCVLQFSPTIVRGTSCSSEVSLLPRLHKLGCWPDQKIKVVPQASSISSTTFSLLTKHFVPGASYSHPSLILEVIEASSVVSYSRSTEKYAPSPWVLVFIYDGSSVVTHAAVAGNIYTR
jgi:hypothetical protein